MGHSLTSFHLFIPVLAKNCWSLFDIKFHLYCPQRNLRALYNDKMHYTSWVSFALSLGTSIRPYHLARASTLTTCNEYPLLSQTECFGWMLVPICKGGCSCQVARGMLVLMIVQSIVAMIVLE